MTEEKPQYKQNLENKLKKLRNEKELALELGRNLQ